MFGFLAFNGGSMADIVKPGEGDTVALAMINTIMCGAFAALIYLCIHYLTKGKWTLLLTINAALAGMVASCGGCNRMEPWASVFTGTGAGLIYLGLSKMMIALKIDDPLDAFAVHAGGGLWGLIAVTIIGHDGIAYSIVDAIDGDNSKIGQSFAQFGWNLICALAIIIWSSMIMIPVFLFLKKIKKFRVIPEVEIKGLDIFKHGEAAYPIHAYGHGWDDLVSEDGRSRARTLSAHAEFSLEELAAAYERRTSVIPSQMSRRISYFHNPTAQRYEQPELHQKALKTKTPNPKKLLQKMQFQIRIGPSSNELYASAPINVPQIVVENLDEDERDSDSDGQHF
uniref:Ammonium transporter AmtB-like domain-containing protein n=1 Tax=Panagrolaimus superbus TaxID=310955 RepID=A0A914Z761_9BILA